MAISRIGSVWAEGASATMPTHQVGDLLVTFAYRDGSATAPTLASGWTLIQSGGANTNSAIAAYKFATGTTDGSDTWTNATEVASVIYRGMDPLLPIGGMTQNGAASTTLDFPTTTLANTSGTSWVVGFAGHRSTNVAITTAPTGMINLAGGNGATASAAVDDTNGPVSSWSDRTVNVGGTSSGWRSMVIEILAPATTMYLRQTTTISHPSSINTGSLSTALPAGTDRSPTAITAMDMNSSMGSGQTSRTSTTGTSAVLTSARVGTWVSDRLNVSTINAQNWTVGFGYQENNANANQFMAFSIYVLKSDGTVRGYIYDSATALSTEFTTAEQGRTATVAGSAVSGIQNTDQLCIEIWATGTQTLTTSRTVTYYWDGGTLVSNGVATSDAGAFVHTGAQALSFYTSSPPNAPTLNSPADTGTVASTTPTLNFTDTDTDGDDLSYEVEVADNAAFSATVAPTLIDTSGNNWSDTSGSTHTTGSLSWQAGDLIIVLGMTENNSNADFSTPTASGLSFSAVAGFPTNTGSTCKGYAWQATAGSSGSDTISAAVSQSNKMANLQAFVYRGSDGVGNSAAIASGSALTASLVRASDNSAVVWAAGDWGATNDTTVSSDPVGGTQRQAAWVSSRATMFCFDWGDQGAAGTTSYGISGFSPGNVFTKIALEIRGSSAGALIDALSSADAGFADQTSPGETDPFPSGDTITYTIQAGDALANTDTYYWRVRAIDPSGSNTWGDWSSTYSFTVNTSGGGSSGNFFYLFSDML